MTELKSIRHLVILSITAIATSWASSHLAAQSTTPYLTVVLTGTGLGTVSSTPAGIDCGVDCEHLYLDGTIVELVATPSIGSKFTGWGGDLDCTDGVITMTTGVSCTAAFDPCAIPSEVTVSGITVAGTETHQACNTLIVGPSVAITGQATFRAGNEIRFLPLFTVTSGATMDAVLGPPLCVLPGTCVLAGQNICAGCVGETLTVQFLSSTDGTCSGFPTAQFQVTCNGSFTSPGDAQIQSVH
jgi:hypothetical protein